MKNLIFLITVMLISFLLVGVATAQSNEVIIWDPNGNLGTFTDPTANFATILSHLTASADVTVSGGGTALISAVASAPSGTPSDPYVIEVASGTYDGGIVISDKTNIVIRAAVGASPVIDCGILPLGTTCLELVASADGLVSNIGIKGLTFKNIPRNVGGSAATGQGIASYSGKILENIVIEDCVFDNSDPSKTQDFKGAAIHINEVDGLLIRRNTIINGAMHFSTSPQEDGAITLHEFLALPPFSAPRTQENFLNNVFIQNNEILFDYSQISGTPVSASTRGIVLAHVGKTTTTFNNIVIEYNLIDNVQKEGIKVFGTSTDATDDETVHVTNNVIKRTADGIEIDGGVVLIDRTIFDGLTSFGPEGKDEAIDHDGGSATVTNTIVANKLKGTTGSPTVTCIDLFNLTLPHPTLSVVAPFFNVDPMFVSPATNDYTIGNPTFPAGCAGGEFGLNLVPPELKVAIDIKPQSCPNPLNTKSKGVLPVAILGSADLDVNDIDVSCILLERVAPIRSAVEDVSTTVVDGEECDCTTDGADGFDDLTLKFDTQEIVAALGSVNDGDQEVLTLTGNLIDGTAIEGKDCVIIKSKGKGLDKAASTALLESFSLEPNYPNPFNPETRITYSLANGADVIIKIFNVRGRLVRTFVNEFKSAGQYSILWDGRDSSGLLVPSGTYIYQIKAGDFEQTRKMVLLK